MIFSDYMVLTVILIIAVVVDLREQRIPNVLILCGLICGVTQMVVQVSDAHILSRICALFLGIGILFIPFALGGIGAGDVKLLGLIGFLTGVKPLVTIALVSFVIGGIISCLYIIGHRYRQYGSARAVLISIMNSVPAKKILAREEGNLAIPFSVPLAVGTLVVLVTKWSVL